MKHWKAERRKTFKSLGLQKRGRSGQREVMKSLRKLLCVLLLGLGIALILAIPAFAQQKDSQVIITDTRIEIYPVIDIQKDDLKKLNEVLGQYDNSLYKVET